MTQLIGLGAVTDLIVGANSSASEGTPDNPDGFGSERLSVIGPDGSQVSPFTIGKKGASASGDVVGMWFIHTAADTSKRWAAFIGAQMVDTTADAESYGIAFEVTKDATNDETVMFLHPRRILVIGQAAGSEDVDAVGDGAILVRQTQANRTWLAHRMASTNAGVAGFIDWLRTGTDGVEDVAVRWEGNKAESWTDDPTTRNGRARLRVRNNNGLRDVLKADGEQLTVGTTGPSCKVGFFGETPTSKPALTYSRTNETEPESQIRQALFSLGLVDDQTTA